MRSNWRKSRAKLDAYLQALRNQTAASASVAERALESTELLAENSDNLPAGIVDQFGVVSSLATLDQQAQRMDLGVASAAIRPPIKPFRFAGAQHPARAVSVAGLVQPAERHYAPGSTPAGDAKTAAAGYRDGATACFNACTVKTFSINSRKSTRSVRPMGSLSPASKTVFWKPSCRTQRAAELPVTGRGYADSGADQAEGLQQSAGRCAERGERGNAPLSLLDSDVRPQ